MRNKVSIIIPVYNVERFLKICLESIINQTYSNIEIIVVNDGSPDSSAEIIEEFLELDNRIIVVNKENGGLSDARNAGLRVATGDYILFVDSDDWIEKNMVADMMSAMLNNQVDLVICDFYHVLTSGKQRENGLGKYKNIVINRQELVKLSLRDKEITNHVWRRLYKKENISAEIFPKGLNFEDLYTTPEFIYHCENIFIINKPLYYYRENPNGIVKTLDFKYCHDYYKALEHASVKYLEYFPELTEEIMAFKVRELASTWCALQKANVNTLEGRALENEIKELIIQNYRFRDKTFFSNLRVLEVLCPIKIRKIYYKFF